MSLMEYKGYHASIEFDGEDQLFVGEVIGINDSLNFHGTSIKELTDNYHQSIDNYLVTCKEIGKQPEKEYRGNLNIRLSPEIHREAVICSASDKISLNQFIGEAVEEKCKSYNINK